MYSVAVTLSLLTWLDNGENLLFEWLLFACPVLVTCHNTVLCHARRAFACLSRLEQRLNPAAL